MSLPEYASTFRDPVHGYIGVFQWEKDIIDSAVFQRLRGIRQLGLTSYVYHGAEHSRFGHSLGVMHLAGRFVDRIMRYPKHRELLREGQKWCKSEFEDKVDQIVLEARLAGLLHDIGHAPFSHTGESTLFRENQRHENYSEAIIRSDEFAIAGIIDDQLCDRGISSTRVADIIGEKEIYEVAFVKELISSVWDVDKMDYLLRDSRYCGVQYGLYDLDRIIDTVTLYDENPDGVLRLGIREGGIHAIEGFILARYFMFTQVYFHKVRRAYDLILTDFIVELLQTKYGSKYYPADLNAYTEWNDWKVLSQLQVTSDPHSLGQRQARRQHPRLIYDTGPHADSMKTNRVMSRLPRLLEEAHPEVRIWKDRATDHPERFRMGDQAWPIRRRDGRWDALDSLSKALGSLEEISQFRIYADVRGDDKLEVDLVNLCREAMG